MDILKEFYGKIESVLLKIPASNKIILYGYNASGIFLKWLFSEKYGREINYIIDKNIQPINDLENKKTLIATPDIFSQLSPRTTTVLLTMSNYREVEDKLIHQIGGYSKNINLFSMKEVIYGSDSAAKVIGFYYWLEYKYKIDLLTEIDVIDLDYQCAEAQRSSPSREMSMGKLFSDYNINHSDAILDFGCGKGAAILLFKEYGFSHIGGVEYSKILFETAQNNLKKLKINDIKLYNTNAADMTDLDSYNYFYYYNPFVGETFRNTIKNIESSYSRFKRKIRIIYANPVCHDLVIESGCFHLANQKSTDYAQKFVNIYETN